MKGSREEIWDFKVNYHGMAGLENVKQSQYSMRSSAIALLQHGQNWLY